MRVALLATTLVLLSGQQSGTVSLAERRALREEVRNMFTFAYDHYMTSAFPADALTPVACAGEDNWGGITLTLLDTLDTLAIMNNSTEFERGVRFVTSGRLSFDRDETVRAQRSSGRRLASLNIVLAVAAGAGVSLRDEYSCAGWSALRARLRVRRQARPALRAVPECVQRRHAATGHRSRRPAAARARHAIGHPVRLNQPAPRRRA
jgi:hypothetical protein